LAALYPVADGKKPAIKVPKQIEHPQTSDDFAEPTLQPQWQWNHNPVSTGWSLRERPGWVRLHGLPATELTLARNSLTQKLWGQAGAAEIKLDISALTEGQRAGLAFMSGKVFNAVGGVVREGETKRLFWDGGTGPLVTGGTVWLRGEYQGDNARLLYSLDGKIFVDTDVVIELKFGQWKGARLALYCYGDGQGAADFDYFHFSHGVAPWPLVLPTSGSIEPKPITAP